MEDRPGPAGHYFDRVPAVASRRRTVTLTLPDLTMELQADRGVFAADGIDPGTKLLLLDGSRPSHHARTLLDLGCGYGAIALALATRAPEATVWAVDVNERALGLCAENAASHGFDGRVRIAAPDDVPPDVTFDGIWSNPPIRIGKPALHALLTGWLDRLVPGGHAELVVHKHLGADSLARWLDAAGWSVERTGSRMGYRILQVTGR